MLTIGSDGQCMALKRFQVLETPSAEIDISGNRFHCNEVTCELIATILCSELYENGISPHFPRVYGVCQQSWATSFFSFWKSKKMAHVGMLMELLDGDMRSFGKIVSQLQQRASEQKRPVYGRQVYVHNAIFQVAAALHEFQRVYKGMHNDLHLGNIMIKLCDDTPVRDHEDLTISP